MKVTVCAGKGGDGCVSFRREKFIPFGGPDGGDGGDGGNIILVADESKSTLSDLKKRNYYRAGDGENGRGKGQHGKNGKTLWIRVPTGTVVRDASDEGGTVLGDLTIDGQNLVVVRGGRGGKGNQHFATSVKQAPRIAQRGEPGEEGQIILDLKLLADVGLVGKPNAGKSTLINAVSAARAKVGDYPFTTLEPKLGVVEIGYESFVIADIPGLIEGAHSGQGLGHEFLRHIERTRMLIHIIDGTVDDPISDFEEINRELFLFNPSLEKRPQLVVVNKVDIPSVRERKTDIEEPFSGEGIPVSFISAATGEGVDELMMKVMGALKELPPPAVEQTGYKVFRPKPIK
ncbi:MAG: GTPase ObgE [Dehalococcoidia bacterium]